jgi:4-amino-4-deoxy-L-arabinose transferase-like glycosyltransferase
MKANRDFWLKTLTLLIVLVALALPRATALDRFVTPDEPKWLMRSANFFLALAQGDFANTYQKEHPGVTVMWAGAAGFLYRYPAYVTLGPGQHDRTQQFHRYLENRSVSAIDLLETGRMLVVMGILIVLALAYLSAVRLIGLLPAFIGFLLIAFDPFLIALSKLLHLDGLLSALVLLSLLAWLNYLYRGRRRVDLILSAGAAGMSWLTKSPGFFLLPFIGLTCLIEIGHNWRTDRLAGWMKVVWRYAAPALVWTGIAAVVFVVFWPAMWVNPLHTLQQVFTAAASYASEGHDSITFFDGRIYQAGISDWRFYPINYFWRATPLVIAGLLLLIFALIMPRRFHIAKRDKWIIFYLALFVIGYTVFMTLGAKKFDRYLLPVFAPVDLLASLGWVTVLKTALEKPHVPSSNQLHRYRWLGGFAVLAVVVIAQAYSAGQTYPYYFSYYNPLAGGSQRAPQVMMIGWGEGLDQAARYLNTNPEAEKLKVASWYSDGPFSYIFLGKTYQPDLPSNPQDLPRLDYIVLYAHQWQRQLPSQEFLDFFAAKTPEKVITIDGLEYARIYRLR